MKNVKIFFKIKSITARLVTFYSIVSLLFIVMVALSSYLVMISVLHDSGYQLLSDEINTLQYILKTKINDFDAIAQEVDELPVASKSPAYRFYTRILDNKEKVFIETLGSDDIFQKNSFFNDFYFKKLRSSKHWTSPDGKNYLLMQSKLRMIGKDKYWIIQIALDISNQKRILHNYHKILVIFLSLATLLSILVSVVIARKSMSHLRNLTETTRKIGINSLHQRLEPQHWPVELQDLAVEFNKMLVRIEDSFSRVTQFSADLAHELRTPINNLIVGTEVSLSSKCSLVDYHNIMESNLEELHRIYSLIENILFLSRAENPQIDIKKEILQIEHEISVIMEFYRFSADEKNIQLIYHGHGAVYANQIMFRRMIGNLISNSLKYTHFGGSITCSISTQSDESVLIVLNDDGIGISKNHLPKIFQRFYRVDGARAHHSGGTGLGLAIVQSIVFLHQGKISITSELHKGTKVTISFPKITNL